MDYRLKKEKKLETKKADLTGRHETKLARW